LCKNKRRVTRTWDVQNPTLHRLRTRLKVTATPQSSSLFSHLSLVPSLPPPLERKKEKSSSGELGFRGKDDYGQKAAASILWSSSKTYHICKTLVSSPDLYLPLFEYKNSCFWLWWCLKKEPPLLRVTTFRSLTLQPPSHLASPFRSHRWLRTRS